MATAAVADSVKKEPSDFRKVSLFLGLVLFSILANYFAPKFIATVLWISVLVAYFRSKDEGFWLAYFLCCPMVSSVFLGCIRRC